MKSKTKIISCLLPGLVLFFVPIVLLCTVKLSVVLGGLVCLSMVFGWTFMLIAAGEHCYPTAEMNARIRREKGE